MDELDFTFQFEIHPAVHKINFRLCLSWCGLLLLYVEIGTTGGGETKHTQSAKFELYRQGRKKRRRRPFLQID